MSALEALEAAHVHGVTITVDGDCLALTGRIEPPASGIGLMGNYKPEIIELLRPGEDGWTAADWRGFFNERATVIEYDGGLKRADAEARALRCCVVEWLNRKPVRSTPECCCWCGGMERGDDALLPFGASGLGRAWLHSACWKPWSDRRQAEARAALTAMGITSNGTV